MGLGVGPIKGTYTGTIRIAGQRQPEHMTLLVEGGGALGSLVAAGTITLSQRGAGTHLTYDGDATVSGPVTMVGERVMSATADRLFAAFLNCVAAEIER
jgi:carbon monoxide dehydrogenase subunit G